MKGNILYIAKLFLIVFFLLPDFAKAFHSHNNQVKCDSAACCQNQENNAGEGGNDKQCPICKFSMYSFETPPSFYGFTVSFYFCDFNLKYTSSIQKSYLLNLKLLRSPPIV